MAAVLAGLSLSACAVGPNFAPPAPPALQRYAPTAGPSRLDADGSSQTITLGESPDAHWWRRFGSAALDALVETGLKDSPTLASARAALTQSQDQARAGAGVFFPSLGAEAVATRERFSPATLGGAGRGSIFSLYTLSGSVSYAVDIFGGERRSVEALNAAADAQHAAAGAAYLSLTGGIVDATIARAGYADEADALAEIVRLDQDQADILTAEQRSGEVALSAVLAAEEQLASDRESLAAVRERQAAAADLLNVLVGREPGADAPATPALGELTVPPDAPVSLPSDLVRQRPDILQAQAELHQASAEVGVATAALFPSISLTGDYGAASTSLAGLASPMGRFWSVGPTIDIPLFQGGERWFARKGAQAGLLKAAADYREAVLTGLQQVADALKALDADAETAAAARDASDAADADRDMANANLAAGVIADYDSIAVRIAADRAQIVLIAARAQRLQDTVALYLACGGGWTMQGGASDLAEAAGK